MRKTNLRTLAVILSAGSLWLPAAAVAEDKPMEQEPGWFKCAADSDCVAIEGPCSRTGAVNAAHREIYAAWVKEAKLKAECPLSTTDVEAVQNPALPFCRDGQCVVGEAADVKSEGSEAKEVPVPLPQE